MASDCIVGYIRLGSLDECAYPNMGVRTLFLQIFLIWQICRFGCILTAIRNWVLEYLSREDRRFCIGFVQILQVVLQAGEEGVRTSLNPTVVSWTLKLWAGHLCKAFQAETHVESEVLTRKTGVSKAWDKAETEMFQPANVAVFHEWSCTVRWLGLIEAYVIVKTHQLQY